MKYLIWLVSMLALMWVSNAMTPVEFANEVWAKPALSEELRNACQDATDPLHCFWIWLSISNAESQMCKEKSSHWCFGLVGSRWDKSPKDWVTRYNKFWYKAKSGEFFYGERWQLPPSRYCTSEHSSNSSVWCPNWLRHFNYIRNSYKIKVMNKLYAPPLDHNIDDWYNHKCRMVWEVREWEYIQVDFLQRLRQMIFPPANSKVFICPK